MPKPIIKILHIPEKHFMEKKGAKNQSAASSTVQHRSLERDTNHYYSII